MKTLGERLAYEMAVMGFTQESLAEKVSVSQVAIFKLVSGETKSSRKINEISIALGVSVDYLVNGTVAEKNDAPPVINRDVWESLTPGVRSLIDSVLYRVKNHTLGEESISALRCMLDVIGNNNHHNSHA